RLRRALLVPIRRPMSDGEDAPKLATFRELKFRMNAGGIHPNGMAGPQLDIVTPRAQRDGVIRDGHRLDGLEVAGGGEREARARASFDAAQPAQDGALFFPAGRPL